MNFVFAVVWRETLHWWWQWRWSLGMQVRYTNTSMFSRDVSLQVTVLLWGEGKCMDCYFFSVSNKSDPENWAVIPVKSMVGISLGVSACKCAVKCFSATHPSFMKLGSSSWSLNLCPSAKRTSSSRELRCSNKSPPLSWPAELSSAVEHWNVIGIVL